MKCNKIKFFLGCIIALCGNHVKAQDENDVINSTESTVSNNSLMQGIGEISIPTGPAYSKKKKPAPLTPAKVSSVEKKSQDAVAYITDHTYPFRCTAIAPEWGPELFQMASGLPMSPDLEKLCTCCAADASFGIKRSENSVSSCASLGEKPCQVGITLPS